MICLKNGEGRKMENLDSIYTELIMEHSMASHNKEN